MADLKYLTPGGHEALAPGDTATGITAGVRNPVDGAGNFTGLQAITALVTIEDNSMRFTVDGTTPTNANGTSADVGHLITAGQNYVVENETGVQYFKCIDAVSGSASKAKVTVFFERIG